MDRSTPESSDEDRAASPLNYGLLCSGVVLTSPPRPMLAQLDTRLPRGDLWAYEPKMDGFRGLLWRPGRASVQLLSRSGRDLCPWFPELTAAAESLPLNTLLDGEIVIADETGQADFGALQQRLTLARKFIAGSVRVTNLDLGRWARFPVAFVRWRPDRSVHDCALDQLSS